MKYIHGKNRIHLEDEKQNTIAEVDFPNLGKNTVVITHTFVDNSLRGKGIASDLVEKVYDDAKEKGHLIKATCPYAVKWFREHPEKCDILAD